MSLLAPLAVPVEVRAEDRGGLRRVFRLSREVGESRLTLERPAPFEIGQRVTITFSLPGGEVDAPQSSVSVRARVALTDDDGEGDRGGRALAFTDPPQEPRRTIALYVASRLGLPPPPGPR